MCKVRERIATDNVTHAGKEIDEKSAKKV